MMDQQRFISGQKTFDQMQEESKAQEQKGDEVNFIKIPSDKFTDFKEINADNQEEFEYMINVILVQFIEQFNDRAIEFPAIIEPTGRAIIHDKCNFLGMASHSQGKNEKRYIIVYPKHLFKDK